MSSQPLLEKYAPMQPERTGLLQKLLAAQEKTTTVLKETHTRTTLALKTMVSGLKELASIGRQRQSRQKHHPAQLTRQPSRQPAVRVPFNFGPNPFRLEKSLSEVKRAARHCENCDALVDMFEGITKEVFQQWDADLLESKSLIDKYINNEQLTEEEEWKFKYLFLRLRYMHHTVAEMEASENAMQND